MSMLKRLTVTALAAVIFCTVLMPVAAGAENSLVEKKEDGRVVYAVWQDSSGNTVTGPDGWAEIRYKYGRGIVAEQYYDENGKPVEVQGGYYRKMITRDGKNRITEIAYQDANGDLMLNSDGYARVTMTYTSFGGITYLRYFGTEKKKVTVRSLGYAAIETEYSGKSVVSRTWVDENGKPVNNIQGFACMKQKLNKNYQPIRTWYEHADGSPATGPDGWSRCERERDKKGRVTSEKYYDEAGKITDRGAGYAWEETRYDGNDRLVTRYGLDGQAVPVSDSAVTIRYRMQDDRVTAESYLKSDGGLTDGPLGVCTVSYEYDYDGRIETVRYRNAAGENVLCSLGYAGYREKRDADGAVTSRTYLGTDGKAMEIPGGYAEERYMYNSIKELTGTRRYDLNGNIVP